MINGVRKIIVPVAEQETAKEFWIARLGFELVRDEAYGDGNQRWIEVTPPDRQVVLVLSLRKPGEPRPNVPEGLPHSPVFFNCDDIEHTYRELVARGVRFACAPVRMSFGWWAMFEDSEGTRHALGQW